jgi:hypothetical protein
MTLSHEHRNERLALTREAAAALLEDLARIRGILGSDEPSRSELRLLSATLRRILVDRDFSNVAAPRIGHIKLLVPNNKPYTKLSEDFTFAFFASGGATLFGLTLRGVIYMREQLTDDEESRFAIASEAMQNAEARLDRFLNRPVLRLDGIWASRKDAIKYIANYASGVHSKTPVEPIELALARIRRCVRYSRHTDLDIHLSKLNDPDPPFEYTPDKLDLVLLEMLVAAKYLVDSPDTARLEEAIASELRAFR